MKQNYTPKLTQLKQSSSMNSNNRIIIKRKKTPVWKNCKVEDINDGDIIRWVGQFKYVLEGKVYTVIEEMLVAKITKSCFMGRGEDGYDKRCLHTDEKQFQKKIIKKYVTVGRSDEERHNSGIKKLTGAENTIPSYWCHGGEWVRLQKTPIKEKQTIKIKLRPSDKCYEQMRQRIQEEADAIVVDWEDFIKTLDA